MSENPVDAVVIGAGIGGTCAALSLAQRGARVMLVEAGDFPRHKVCGEFLSPESRATFYRLGVEDAILEAGALPVHATRIISNTGVLRVPLPPGALALSRFRLDALLWSAAKAGGVLCQAQTRVKKVADNVVETATKAIHAKAVIAAPGRGASWLKHNEPNTRATSIQAPRYIGLKAHFRNVRLEAGVVELHTWRGGYCGLVRVEDGFTNVCLLSRYDVIKERSQRAPEAFWQWLLARCPALSRRFKKAEMVTPWLATANVSFGRQLPVEPGVLRGSPGVLRCGDAAGYIHPLTGDGMAMAARSGELAGAIIGAQLRGGLSAHDAAVLYEAAWRREFAARLQWAARLEPLLTSPVLTTVAIPLLARAPRLARMAVARTRGV